MATTPTCKGAKEKDNFILITIRAQSYGTGGISVNGFPELS